MTQSAAGSGARRLRHGCIASSTIPGGSRRRCCCPWATIGPRSVATVPVGEAWGLPQTGLCAHSARALTARDPPLCPSRSLPPGSCPRPPGARVPMANRTTKILALSLLDWLQSSLWTHALSRRLMPLLLLETKANLMLLSLLETRAASDVAFLVRDESGI